MIGYRARVGAAASAFVLLLASCGGGGGGSAYKVPKGPATATLKVEAGNIYFKPKNPSVSAGIVNLELDGAGGNHTLVFDGKEAGFQLEVSGSGDSQSQKIDLKPGKYTFYCDIPGHRAQGMQGTLTVK
ncbi:MAG TPA: plastocyanin/azurin family copper-binding protein [Acidimicrobiia bacterium]